MDKKYTILSTAKINDNKTLVISKFKDGGYTIAQRFEIEDNGKTKNIFLNNTMQFNDVNGLYDVRDALNIAIDKIESKK